MKIDRFDIKILEVLQLDGRMPTARLAERIGLSASPTWERVRRMEQAGILRGYRGEVAVEELVKLMQVFVLVCLENHRTQDFKRFEKGVLAIPNVVACWAVGGTIDYVLHFVVPNVDSYQEAIEAALEANLGIRQYWSHIVTKPIKRFSGIPVGLFLKDGQEI